MSSPRSNSLTDEKNKKIEDGMTCPITGCIFYRPVTLLPRGMYVVEEEAAKELQRLHKSFPTSAEVDIVTQYVHNVTVQGLVDSYLEMNPEAKERQFEPAKNKEQTNLSQATEEKNREVWSHPVYDQWGAFIRYELNDDDASSSSVNQEASPHSFANLMRRSNLQVSSAEGQESVLSEEASPHSFSSLHARVDQSQANQHEDEELLLIPFSPIPAQFLNENQQLQQVLLEQAQQQRALLSQGGLFSRRNEQPREEPASQNAEPMFHPSLRP